MNIITFDFTSSCNLFNDAVESFNIFNSIILLKNNLPNTNINQNMDLNIQNCIAIIPAYI